MTDLTLNPNIDYSKIILSDAQRAEVASYVDDEVRRLARFTSDAEADKLPEGLLNGISREVWRTMTPAKRAIALRANSHKRRTLVVVYRLGKLQANAAPRTTSARLSAPRLPAPVRPPATLTPPRPSTATALHHHVAPRMSVTRGAWLPPAERVAPADPAPARLWILPTDVVSSGSASHFVSCSGGCGRMIPTRPGRPAVGFCSPAQAQRVFTKRPPRDQRDVGRKLPKARVLAVCSAITE